METKEIGKIFNILILLAVLVIFAPGAVSARMSARGQQNAPPEWLKSQAEITYRQQKNFQDQDPKAQPTVDPSEVGESNAHLSAPSPRPMTRTIADAENVGFVGHIGGDANAVIVQEPYAYVGEGPQLTILDLSAPATPSVVGKTTPMPDNILDIVVNGDYAYVADSEGGLRIVDVSDPTQPHEVGTYGTSGVYANGVAVSNSTAYVTSGSGLQVVDVSDPAHPAEVGAYYISGRGYTNDVVVSGGTAYVADRWGGLRVMDVSDSANPSEISSYDMSGHAQDVFISGSTAYVATTEGLRVMDVSDSANPSEVGAYDTPIWISTEGVYVSGSTAYIVGSTNVPNYDGWLWVVDVSNPTNLSEISAYDTSGGSMGVYVSNSIAYVAAGPHGGLRMIDVSDPTQPREVGAYVTPGAVNDIDVSGSFVYAVDVGGLRVVDVSDPTQPRTVGDHYISRPGYASGVAVSSSMAYVVGCNGSFLYLDGLWVMDVSDPVHPSKVSFHHTPGEAQDVFVSGSIAYVATTEGLRVMDVSDPANPNEVSNMPGCACDVFVNRNTAYVAGDADGLRIVEVSNPLYPREVGVYDTLGIARGVYVSGTTAYIASSADYDGLWVVDVSDPVHPSKVSFYYTPYVALDVFVSGSTAYVANNYGGLQVVDLSDLAHLSEVGFYNTPGEARKVYVSGSTAYIADYDGGLFILRYSEGGISYAISGYVNDNHGNPISGVTISTTTSISATTDADGAYMLTGLLSGTYTLTPIKPGWDFRPPTRTVRVPPDITSQDFTMLHPPISRTLTPSDTTNLPYTLRYIDAQGLTTTLTFRVGVVTQTTTVVLTPTLAQATPGGAFAGHAFDLEAYQGGTRCSCLSFRHSPVTVTIHYSTRDTRLISDEEQLTLRWWNGSAWQDAAETCDPPSTYSRDREGVLSVPICHLSRWALFGPTFRIYLPLVLREG